MTLGRTILRRARTLRESSTDAERRFWYRVRDRRLGGYNFRRQHPIGPYIADFVCLESRIVVELDGGQHSQAHGYDDRRTEHLQSLGFTVIRFSNLDVLLNCNAVLELLLEWLNEDPSP